MVGEAALPSWLTYVQGTGFTITVNDIYLAGTYFLLQYNEVLTDYWLTTHTMSGWLYLDPCPITSFYGKYIENMSRIVNQGGTSV